MDATDLLDREAYDQRVIGTAFWDILRRVEVPTIYLDVEYREILQRSCF